MNENLLFTVETTMDTKDYRKFLYIATFLRSKVIIPFILAIAALMAWLLTFSEGYFNVTKFIIYWLFLAIIAFLTVIFKVERKNKQRIKTDRTGAFGAKETLEFYESFVVIKSTAFEGKLRLNIFNSTSIESRIILLPILI